MTCDLVATGRTVTAVTQPPPSDVPSVISRDGQLLLRQERELIGRRPNRYLIYLEVWDRQGDGWVRRPRTFPTVDDLPDDIRAAFGLDDAE